MSFILDALRKAEQERNLGQPPDVRSLHSATASSTRARLWPWWLGAALLANLLVLTVIGWWGRGDTVLESLDSGLVTAPLSEVMPNIKMQSRPDVRPVFAESPYPQPLPEPKPEPAILPVPEPTPKITLAPQAVAPVEVLPEPVPVPVAIPLLRNLPASVRNAIPRLKLDVHVYSTDAAKRFVLINSRRYREGDWLGEGPMVETITEQGVILQYRGRRFELPVPR